MTPDQLSSIAQNVLASLAIISGAIAVSWTWLNKELNKKIDRRVESRITLLDKQNEQKFLNLVKKLKELKDLQIDDAENIYNIVKCASEAIKNLAKEQYATGELLRQVVAWAEKDKTVEIVEITLTEWLTKKIAVSLKEDDVVTMNLIKIILELIYDLELKYQRVGALAKRRRSFVRKTTIEDIEEYQARIGIMADYAHKIKIREKNQIILDQD